MTKQPNYITLKIKLTPTTISVSSTNQEKQEEIIELIPGIKEYPINIQFNKNEIIVFMNKLMNKHITIQQLYNYTLIVASSDPSSSAGNSQPQQPAGYRTGYTGRYRSLHATDRPVHT